MLLKSKRITHPTLDNENFPVFRPSAYGRIARLDHEIRLLEDDGNLSHLLLPGALFGFSP